MFFLYLCSVCDLVLLGKFTYTAKFECAPSHSKEITSYGYCLFDAKCVLDTWSIVRCEKRQTLHNRVFQSRLQVLSSEYLSDMPSIQAAHR